MNVDFSPFTLDLQTSFRTAGQSVADRRGIVIRLRDDAGIGVGEATPLAGWTESYERCRRWIESFATRPPPTPASIALPRDRPAARHAVQLAVMDGSARRAGRPLAQYLRAGSSQTIPLNATVPATTTDETVRAVSAAVDAGFDTIKLKVGRSSVVDDVRRIEAVRAAIGDSPSIRLDANRSWTLDQAHEALARLGRHDIAYVEEPLRTPTKQTLLEIRRHGVPVALDESLNRGGWMMLSELERAVEAVILKPMSLGGVDRVVSAARRAKSLGMLPVISGTLDGAIARTAAMHVAAALTPHTAAGLATAEYVCADIGLDPVRIVDGTAHLPSTPGIGLDGPWTNGAQP